MTATHEIPRFVIRSFEKIKMLFLIVFCLYVLMGVGAAITQFALQFEVVRTTCNVSDDSMKKIIEIIPDFFHIGNENA